MDKCVLFIVFLAIPNLNGDRITINLRKQQLTEIPNNITPAVEILLLKGNSINQISATDLSTFVNLSLLDLDYNGLKYLTNGCFDNNEKLSILKLSFNNIHHYPLYI